MSSLRYLPACVIFCLIALCFSVNSAFADDDQEDRQIRFDVYTVHASKKSPVTNPVKCSAEQDQAPEQAIPKSLELIRHSLTQVPFQTFAMRDHQELTLPLKKKGKLQLADNHSVVVRPLYVDGDRLCLWVKWKDQDGMEILDSRLHVSLGDSVVAGIEHADEEGIVLAVRAVAE